MGTKRLIIYDLDGTLVDTREDIAQAANHMLARMGKPSLSREEICRFVGNGVVSLVQGCLKTQEPEPVRQGVQIYRAYYAKHFLDYSRLYPGAREVLEYFRQRRQAVITNKPNPFSRDILAGLGILEFFTDLIAGDSGTPVKPDPKAIRSLMDESRVSPQETLVVGDSPIDVEMGRNAGVEAAVLTHGFGEREEIAASNPAAILDHFKDLLDLAIRERW